MPACFPPPDIIEEELGNVPELPCDNLEEVSIAHPQLG